MRHAEQRVGEVFLGNFAPNDLLQVGWKSIRTGEKAYCKDGSPYPFQKEHGVKPVFVSCDEIERAVSSELAGGDQLGRVRAYRQLLDTRG